MKGVIVDCLRGLVENKFGKEKWKEALELAGFPPKFIPLSNQDIPDEDVLKLVNAVCKVLNITLTQAADAFGDYWVNEYAVRIYRIYYKPKTAKEFLLNMDKVHQQVTKTMKNASPPRFDYEWKDDKTLIMTYKSKRGLIDFLVGLIKGVGKYYKENLRVMKLGSNKVQIKFG
jgi:hypothetical protein